MAATLNLEVSKKERRLLKRLLWSLSLGSLFLIGCDEKSPMVQEQAAPVITQVKDKEAFQASVEQANENRKLEEQGLANEHDLGLQNLANQREIAEGRKETAEIEAAYNLQGRLAESNARLLAADKAASAGTTNALVGAGASLAGGIFQAKAQTEILAKNARLEARQAELQKYTTDAQREVAMANLEAQERLADKRILEAQMKANAWARFKRQPIPYPEIENLGSENQGSENPTGVTQSRPPSASSSSAPPSDIPAYASDYFCYGDSGGVGDCDANVKTSYLSQMNKGLEDLYNELKTCEGDDEQQKKCRAPILDKFGQTILDSHQVIATQIEGSGVLNPDTLQAKIEKNQAALLHFVKVAKERDDFPTQAPTLNDVIEDHAAFLDAEERNKTSMTRDVGAVFARLDPEPGHRQGNGTEVNSNPKNGAGSDNQNPQGRSVRLRGK